METTFFVRKVIPYQPSKPRSEFLRGNPFLLLLCFATYNIPQSRIKEKVSHFIIKKSCYWRVDSLGSGEHKHESFEKIEAAVLICSSK